MSRRYEHAPAWMVSLPMYDLAPIRAITDEWWQGLAERLSRAGIEGVPAPLTREPAREQQWRSPQLLLSQTCGYPLSTAFRDHLCVLVTPRYTHPGCSGANYSSLIIVHEDDAARDLDALAGSTFAVNGQDSWSGWHALVRELRARGHDPGTFVARIRTTGTHAASIRAVAERRARAAAIDCVTHGLLAAHAPQRLSQTRVLAHTQHAPGLPYVTSSERSERTRQRLRQGLRAAFASAALAPVRDALGIAGCEERSAADYAFMAEQEA